MLNFHTLDPEIDKTLRRLFKEKKDREAVMACQEERRALRDYAIPSLIGIISCIKKPTIQVDNFKLRYKMIVNLEVFLMMIRISILQTF